MQARYQIQCRPGLENGHFCSNVVNCFFAQLSYSKRDSCHHLFSYVDVIHHRQVGVCVCVCCTQVPSRYTCSMSFVLTFCRLYSLSVKYFLIVG